MKFPLRLEIAWINGKPIRRRLTSAEQQWVLAQLTSRKTRFRWMAADTIGKLGIQEGLMPLVARLNDPSWLVRLHAAKALGRLGNPQAVPALLNALADEDFSVRCRVIGALSLTAGEASLPTLLKILKTDNRYREYVFSALSHFMLWTTASTLCRAILVPTTCTPLNPLTKWIGRFLTPLLLWLFHLSHMPYKLNWVNLLGQVGDARAIIPLMQFAQKTNAPWPILKETYRAISQIEYRKYCWALFQ